MGRGPLRSLGVRKSPGDPDFTLEILMTNLDRKMMSQFYKKEKSAREVTKASGISDLFPDAIIDDYLFDPCGYSMNGLLDQGYLTIHITPQPSCSFVSFETNIRVPNHDYSNLVEKVLNTFKPGSFTVTLFGGHVEDFSSIAAKTFQSRLLGPRAHRSPHLNLESPLYLRSTQSHYTFENYYELVFAHYELDEPEQQQKTSGQKRKHHPE